MHTVNNFSDLDLTKTYNYSDYLTWKFNERVELIKGFILKMSPALSSAHQTVSNNLSGVFYENFKRKPCRVFNAPFDVRLPIKSQKKTQPLFNLIYVLFAMKTKLTKKVAMAFLI